MSTIYGAMLLEPANKSILDRMRDGEIRSDGSETTCDMVKDERGTRIDPPFHPDDKPFVYENVAAESNGTPWSGWRTKP